jgi:hypothetical protein
VSLPSPPSSVTAAIPAVTVAAEMLSLPRPPRMVRVSVVSIWLIETAAGSPVTVTAPPPSEAATIV